MGIGVGINPTALITGHFEAPGGRSKGDPFELRAGPFLGRELRVLSVAGCERVNDVYAYDVTFATEVPPEALPATVFGEPACLTIKAPGYEPRVIQGLVSELEAQGGMPGERKTKRRRYRLQIVPRVWLLKRGRRHRIFQNKSVPEIVDVLLGGIEIPDAEVHWRIHKPDYPKLPFVYQRGESDYEFFRRVLADAGIFFYFEHASGLLDSLLPGAGQVAGAASTAAGMLGGAVGSAVGTVANVTKSVTVLNFGSDAGHTPAVSAGLASDLATAAIGAGLSAAAGALGGAIGGATGAKIGSSLADDDPSDTLLFDDGGGTDAEAERVYSFALKKRLRTKSLRMLDHDPEPPANWSHAIRTGPVDVSVGIAVGGAASVAGALSGALSAGVSVGTTGISGGLGGGLAASLSSAVQARVDFDVDAPNLTGSDLREELYQVDRSVWQAKDPDARMAMELERRRDRYLEAVGRSDSRRFGAGYRFTLDRHPIRLLNGEYTITSLVVEGVHPDFAHEGTPVFRVKFRCIPSKVAPRPKRPTRRPKASMEIATVVNYLGGEALPGLNANACGYVCVRFRWDIVDDQGTPRGGLELGADDANMAWIPVMQPWAGAGFGAQFIPREGMQVLVGYLEDQSERPMILGCLYSEANLPPWPDPVDHQKVGIRSRSRPTDGGYSEISIDDRQGGELVQVRAQRDLDVQVIRESRTNVGADRFVTVEGKQTTHVAQEATLEVDSDRTTTVGGDDTREVRGDASDHIVGSRTVTVDASSFESVMGSLSVAVSGTVDTTTEDVHTARFQSDFVARHGGHRVVVVGDATTPRSTVLHTEGAVRLYGAGTVEAVSPTGLTITCGKSEIRITPEAITFSTPKGTLVTHDVEIATAKFVTSASDAISHSGKTVNLASSGATLALDSNVSAQGSQIKLAGGSGTSANADDTKTVTTITLADQDGKPLADQRVLVRKGGDGGEERMVVLDAKGTIDIVGSDPFDVAFPDVLLEGAPPPSASAEPLVIQQGDYLTAIAHARGCQVDDIWGNPANDKLRAKRSNPNMLAPGDVLFVPKVPRQWSSARIGSTNPFKANIPKIDIHLTLVDKGSPLAGAAYAVVGAGAPLEGVTGSDGSLTVAVPITVRTLRLKLTKTGHLFDVGIGTLDPIEALSGVQMRLAHLGLYAGPTNNRMTDHLHGAIAAFQRSQNLPPTGDLDETTLDKLRNVHGS